MLVKFLVHVMGSICLQCFDAVGWAAGRASCISKTRSVDKLVVVTGLELDANDLYVFQLLQLPTPLYLAAVIPRIV